MPLPDAMKLFARKNHAGLKPLHGDFITGGKIRLREKKLSDVRNDFLWQSDDELSRLDATEAINISFSIYLLDYTTSLQQQKNSRYPLAIETLEGEHIGNCTCYDIDERKSEAQVGIMIGNKTYWDKGYGQDTLEALVDFVFRTSSLNRLYLKTLEWNERAQRCFVKCGFNPCGHTTQHGHHFLLMELKRNDWEKRRHDGAG